MDITGMEYGEVRERVTGMKDKPPITVSEQVKIHTAESLDRAIEADALMCAVYPVREHAPVSRICDLPVSVPNDAMLRGWVRYNAMYWASMR